MYFVLNKGSVKFSLVKGNKSDIQKYLLKQYNNVAKHIKMKEQNNNIDNEIRLLEQERLLQIRVIKIPIDGIMMANNIDMYVLKSIILLSSLVILLFIIKENLKLINKNILMNDRFVK